MLLKSKKMLRQSSRLPPLFSGLKTLPLSVKYLGAEDDEDDVNWGMKFWSGGDCCSLAILSAIVKCFSSSVEGPQTPQFINHVSCSHKYIYNVPTDSDFSRILKSWRCKDRAVGSLHPFEPFKTLRLSIKCHTRGIYPKGRTNIDFLHIWQCKKTSFSGRPRTTYYRFDEQRLSTYHRVLLTRSLSFVMPDLG